MDEAQLVRQPLLAHLLELRKRLLWSAIIFGAATAAAYVARNPLFYIIQAPYKQPLYYTSPSGGFEFFMRICMMVGVVAAVPALIYNLIKFSEPALPFRLNRRMVIMVILLSLALLIAGVAFAYMVILPLSLHFFGTYGNSHLRPLISASDYLSFVVNCLVAFAIIFQIPLMFLIANRIRPLPPRQLMRYQRHVIVASLVIAIILPFTYDPIMQFVVAIPIIMLYELSVFLVWLVNMRSKPAPTPEAVELSNELIPDVLDKKLKKRTKRTKRTKQHIRSSHLLDLRNS